ncbi:hypothetical protein QV13_12730 [Mesorhizobium hungaricum]|uniref:Portal protein n=2 Tax=Pseudomonadota TaxID=1224 RepID=A0A1C2DSK8_9HYPH|nr:MULTISPECIES: hypothetical protein [Mesorhizobium]MBN9236016.1 hypothetical protein [Mesorhizobium sp.]OCX17615.1 hypothetical protein QV13_12730 [Mesorhizobium hungaricum]
MADELETEVSDTLVDEGGEARSSSRVLSAIKKATDTFRDYQDTCRRIDDVYSRDNTYDSTWLDPDYDLFWSSMEILKPAIYAHAPVPAVAPMFADRRPLYNTTAELLERVTTSAFDRTNLDQSMLSLRDDLAFTNRGVLWVTYESEDGEQRACVDHVDRTDFLHEPARCWADVGWVARRAWMTKTEMRKRFGSTSGKAYQQAKTEIRRDDKDNGSADDSKKAGVWEVWHRNDNKVYWVAPDCPVMLDEGEPHLKLRDFYPCPRPAYGTLRRRSLVPVPDYVRYAAHLSKISTLTSRIYLLLDKVRLKVLIPAGGDIGDAIDLALRSDDDEIVIPVPAAALMASAGSNLMVTLPLKELAEAIQGLIASRGQLFEDFYQLSGISDIMRGATEAQETLGAQQLKSQYGSVRVRDKIDELQRVARDVARIVAEIASDKFSKETLLDMAQMEIPSKAEIAKNIKGIEESAKQELKALGEKAKGMAQQAAQGQQPGQPQGQQVDPQQAQQQFQAAQQQIIQKYAGPLKQAEETVPIEDVIDLLRDDRTRGFAFEIATDSTIMTDEVAEKAARNEFLGVVAQSTQALVGLAQMGEAGAALAGGFLKFVTAPYRVGRELNGLIDDFVDAAPQMAAQMAGQQGNGDAEKAMADANAKLADAEMEKAKAAMAGVQAKAALDQAENQRKIAELQIKAQNDQAKTEQENGKLKLQLGDLQTKGSKAQAEIDNLTAQTAKILASIGLDERKQQLSEYTAANHAQAQQVDQAMQAAGQVQQAKAADKSATLADRQQSFAERQGTSAETRANRQQSFAEQQAAKEPAQ